MNIISFGVTDANMLYPCASALFSLVRSFFPYIFDEENRYSSSLTFKAGLMGLGMVLCLIFEIIRIHRTGGHYIQPLKKYKKKPHLIPLLILSGFMDFFAFYMGGISSLGKDININETYIISFMMIFEFLFVYFIYHFFYKTREFKRHHLFSIGLIVTGTICSVGAHFKYFSWIHLFSLCSSIDISFIEILLYKLMTENGDYLSHFEITWIQGFIDFTISFILSLIFNMVPCDYNQNPYCSKKGKVVDLIGNFQSIFTSYKTILQVLVYIVMSTGKNVYKILTTKVLGPTHRIISDGIISVITLIVALDKQEKNFMISFQIIGHILLISGILVYNEIVILHFCNLDELTKKGIIERITEDGEGEQKAELLEQVARSSNHPSEPVPSNENENDISKIDHSKLDF